MSWRMIGKPTTQVADRALIERFAKMQRFGGERKLDKARCARLEALLREGKFRTCTWAVCKCLEDGREYRVNGQHTSHVLSEFVGPLPTIFITTERYEADIQIGVADLFSTFDPRWSSRTTSDTNHAFSHSVESLSGLPSRLIDLAASGIIEVLFYGKRNQAPQDVRGRLVVDYADFVLWIDSLNINRPEKKHLRRSTPVAAMFSTYIVDPSEATRFWTEVSTSSNPLPDAPSRALERFLMTAKANEANEIYAKCIHAWNAYRRNVRELGVLKWFPKAPRPEAI